MFTNKLCLNFNIFYFLYYWKSRIWNLSGRKSLWIIVLSKLLLVLWHCQHTTDGIYILTRLETSHPGNYLYWYSNISRSVLCSAHRSAFNLIIKKTEHFPFKSDLITLVGEVWCFSSVPTQILLLNVLHSCWQFHIVVSHCRRSYGQK